jgi:hypothetical protein
MRIAARKNSGVALPRREQMTNDHLRSAPLRKLFPQIEQLRIELVFSDASTHMPPPSSQLHTLFPAAPAFFRFACPCADCDGDFDLTETVSNLLMSTATRKRGHSLSGQVACHGVRFRTHPVHQAQCSIRLHYQLVYEIRRAA